MKITTIGFGLGKTVFQTCGIDQHGKICLRKQIAPNLFMIEFGERIQKYAH